VNLATAGAFSRVLSWPAQGGAITTVPSATATISRQPVAGTGWPVIVPPALALVYPWMVVLLSRSVSAVRHPGAVAPSLAWVGVTAAVLLICAVPAIGVAVAYQLGRNDAPTRRQLRARWIAYLAVASPSLLLAFGNYSRLLHARAAVTPAWDLLWLGCLAAVLIGGGEPAAPPALSSARRIQVRTFHLSTAIALLVLFLAPHITNHVTGIWSGQAHISLMGVLRTVYRARVIEPLLMLLLVVQAASGLALVSSRLRGCTRNIFQALQTASGVYLVIFLVSHVAAAFSARAAGVDPNWVWLVGRSGTLLSSSVLTVVPHYFFGPLALFVHVGCGARNLRLAREASLTSANRLAVALMATGAMASLVILAALSGVHLAQ
jgi:hypothetical protein